MKKSLKLKPSDIIILTWLDAFGRGSWNDMNDVKHGLQHHILAEIIGYYVTEDKNFMVLSMGHQTDLMAKPFLHLEFIPQGSITEIKKIKE